MKIGIWKLSLDSCMIIGLSNSIFLIKMACLTKLMAEKWFGTGN